MASRKEIMISERLIALAPETRLSGAPICDRTTESDDSEDRDRALIDNLVADAIYIQVGNLQLTQESIKDRRNHRI